MRAAALYSPGWCDHGRDLVASGAPGWAGRRSRSDGDHGAGVAVRCDRRLWQAVIARALRDAVGRAERSDGNPGRLQQEALTWFLESWVEFAAVCDLAGLGPPRAVRLAALQAIARVLTKEARRRAALLDRIERRRISARGRTTFGAASVHCRRGLAWGGGARWRTGS
jgi:hypothetical protein